MSASLFEQFKALGLPGRDYVIFGSGPLAIRGVIPASNDLDILCRGRLWEEVKGLGTPEYLPEFDVSIVTLADGGIDRWAVVCTAGIRGSLQDNQE